MVKIESLLDDIKNTDEPIPQVLIELKNLKESIIIYICFQTCTVEKSLVGKYGKVKMQVNW